MKLKNILAGLASLAGVMLTCGCEGEKDLVIIEGNLPIKTSALYMVGDATPNGWSIDSPTPLTATEEDPLVFEWEGTLYSGEVKLCLTTGSWDAPFIRPLNNGEEISRTGISGQQFTMHAGDPDNKWKVTDAGVYNLRFDLRNWTMSTLFVRELDAPTIEPIAAENLYMVGDATPGGWGIDNPTELQKKSTYIFEYEGPLTAGELKCCTSTGSWDVPFIRPASDGVEITRGGIAADNFVYTASPDHKWRVADAGIYRLTFNLENWTVVSEYLGEIPAVEKDPIETETLFMIGDATPGGWSMDDATEFTVSASDKYVFQWEGELVQGNMKACLVRDGSFSCPFIRPESAGVDISRDGVAASSFTFSTNPDDQWRIVDAGRYRITFNLRDWTIAVRFLGGDEPGGEKEPIETETLFMIGDATPNGWSMDDATEFTVSPSDKYVFVWEGELKEGNMKACLERDGTFSCPFIRPESAGVEISRKGVAAPGFVFTKNPDDQWRIAEAGRYRITFNLRDWTISAESID